MESMFHLVSLFAALFCFAIVRRFGTNKSIVVLSKPVPTDWPILGMFPDLLSQVYRINDWITGILLHLGQTNFLLKGPWFCNMDMLLIADPANINYIMTTNFDNYPKGPEFRRIFSILGDGIFNVDGEQWKDQRRINMSFLNHKKFHNFSLRSSRDKIHNGLFPILDRASREGLVVDLQDLFQRFAFDTICKLATGFDPESLSDDLPKFPLAEAIQDTEEEILFRHILPEFAWRFHRCIGFGSEKKSRRAWKLYFDQIIERYIINMERENQMKSSGGEDPVAEEADPDLLRFYISMKHIKLSCMSHEQENLLRDSILSIIIAGRDTNAASLTWFFWNISNHPSVEAKIREEISSVEAKYPFGSDEFIDKLVYLHAAICESLRLHPPVPLQHKRPIKPDRLPSGHEVRPQARIIWSLYAMGRMASIWGKDCEEYKPERWITEKGTIKHEPSYKFPAFNSGPRSCLGKKYTFTQIKTVLAAVIRGYYVRIEEGQDVRPHASVMLHMKYGLKARISKISNDF